jgi:hypothetical protein
MRIWQISVQLPKFLKGSIKLSTSNKVLKPLKRLKQDLVTMQPPKDLMDAFANSRISGDKIGYLKVCSMVMNVRKRPYILVLNPEGIEKMQELKLAKIARKREVSMKRLHSDKKKRISHLAKEKKSNEHMVTLDHRKRVKNIERSKKSLKWKKKALNTQHGRFKKALKKIGKLFESKVKKVEKAIMKKGKSLDKSHKRQSNSVVKAGKKEMNNWSKKVKGSDVLSRSLKQLEDKLIEYKERPFSHFKSKKEFSSDSSVLVEIDDGVSSMVVASLSGTPLTEHSPYKAMNLSLQFP